MDDMNNKGVQLLSARRLKEFQKTYSLDREARALQCRGEFLAAFPARRLRRLTLERYVIGLQRPTFCNLIEAGTRAWANMQGATALKFGIYYGVVKSDPNKRYRFAQRFGDNAAEAFVAIRSALVDLVDLGSQKKPDFPAIDRNPLSQMLKAKILSLYFPHKFINTCSAEHLESIGIALGLDAGLYSSEYQFRIVQAKNNNDIARDWSNPKFTAFLYRSVVNTQESSLSRPTISPPSKTSYPEVDFAQSQESRDRIGKSAERFALKWEKRRLQGANLAHLIKHIKDVRNRPGHGYDFESHSEEEVPMYIEVKSAGRIKGNQYRFFLSENELSKSKDPKWIDGYFFYLVYFDSQGKPQELRVVAARDMYERAELRPAAYTVRFSREDC